MMPLLVVLLLLVAGPAHALTLTPSAVVPVGGVLMVDTGNCPSGYTEVTAARGRSLVGTPSGGTTGGTVGTALTDQQNKAAPTHSHSVPIGTSAPTVPAYQSTPPFGTASGNTRNYIVPGAASDNAAVTYDLTSATSGVSTGDIIPYLQVKLCKKS